MVDIEFLNKSYLTNIPQDMDKYGFCKTLIVRREIIHIKHIFTEIFIRKTIDIQKHLDSIGWSLFDYIEYMTKRIRIIHHFSRNYTNKLNDIVKHNDDHFFPDVELYCGLNKVIALDFDGVITKNSFSKLYKLCIDRCDTVVCSGNPTIKESWFEVRNLPLPLKINSCKGKKMKMLKLLDINLKNDIVFYIDNEKEYLEFAWIFGIKTYIYEKDKIKRITLKSK